MQNRAYRFRRKHQNVPAQIFPYAPVSRNCDSCSRTVDIVVTSQLHVRTIQKGLSWDPLLPALRLCCCWGLKCQGTKCPPYTTWKYRWIKTPRGQLLLEETKKSTYILLPFSPPSRLSWDTVHTASQQKILLEFSNQMIPIPSRGQLSNTPSLYSPSQPYCPKSSFLLPWIESPNKEGAQKLLLQALFSGEPKWRHSYSVDQLI